MIIYFENEKYIEYLCKSVKNNKNKNLIIFTSNFSDKIIKENFKKQNKEKIFKKIKITSFKKLLIKVYKELEHNKKILSKEVIITILHKIISTNKFNTIQLIKIKDSYISDAYKTIKSVKENSYNEKELQKLKFLDVTIKKDFLKIIKLYEDYKKGNNYVDYFDILDLLINNTNYFEILKEKLRKFEKIIFKDIEILNKKELKLLNSILNNKNTNLDILIKKERINKNNKIGRILKEKKEENLILKNHQKINYENLDIKLFNCLSEDYSYNLIIEKIKESQNKEIGIIFNNDKYLFKVSKILKNLNIEHNFYGKINIFENYYIRRIINILKIITEKNPSSEVFIFLDEIVEKKEVLKEISNKIRKNYYNHLKILDLNALDLKEKEKKKIKDFIYKIDKTKYSIEENNISDIINIICENFKLYEELEKSKDLLSLKIINQLIEKSKEFETIYNKDIKKFLTFLNLNKYFEIIDYNFKNNISLLKLDNIFKKFDVLIVPFLNEKIYPKNYVRNHFFNELDEDYNSYLKKEKEKFQNIFINFKEKIILSYFSKYSKVDYFSKYSRFLDDLEIEAETYNKNLNLEEKVDSKKERNDENKKEKKEDKKNDKKIIIRTLNDYFSTKKEDKNINKEKNKKLTLSATKIETYLSCPKKYEFFYIYNLPQKPKPYFSFGNSVHKVLEILIKNYIYNSQENNPNKLFVKFLELLKDNWIKEGYDNKEQMKEYFDTAIKIAKDIINIELKRKKDRKILDVERRFNIKYKDEVNINGIIDRIDDLGNKIEVIDYKTSNSMKDFKDLKQDVQLYVYKKAVEELYQKKVSKISLWYVMHNNYVSVNTNEIDEETIVKKIQNVIEGIKNKKFEPKPSFLCNYCDFQNICDKAYRN